MSPLQLSQQEQFAELHGDIMEGMQLQPLRMYTPWLVFVG